MFASKVSVEGEDGIDEDYDRHVDLWRVDLSNSYSTNFLISFQNSFLKSYSKSYSKS